MLLNNIRFDKYRSPGFTGAFFLISSVLRRIVHIILMKLFEDFDVSE